MSVSGVRPTRLQTPQVGDLIDGFKVIETDGRLQLVDSSTKLLRAEWGVTPAQDARLRDLKNNQAHWRASFMPGKPENFQIVEEEIARLEEELEPKKQWITPVKLVHTLLSPIQKDVLDRKNIHVIDFDDITGSVRVESGEEGQGVGRAGLCPRRLAPRDERVCAISPKNVHAAIRYTSA